MSKVGVATKEELIKAKPQLDKIFYSSELVMGSLPRLWEMVKEKTKIPFRVTKGYYDNQAVVQLFKRPKKAQRTYPIQTSRPLNVIFMDTMVIDEYRIINTIDLFSKFASSTVFRKEAVTSADAVKALKGFLHDAGVELSSIKEIRCDGGPEFLSVFAQYTEDKTVKALPYAKTQMSPVERFNGTMRRMLEKLKAVEGKPISWAFKYVPKAVKAYNGMVHSSTGYTPTELLKNREAQTDVLSKQRRIPSIDNVKAGDSVRINVRDIMNPFDRKIAPMFSKEVYKVKSVRGNVVTLENGNVELQDHQVQVIDPDLLMNANKIKVVSQEEKEEKRRQERKRRELRNLADYNQAPSSRREARV